MIAEYTIEQFIEDFEMAQTPDAKQALFQNLIESDIDLVDNKGLRLLTLENNSILKKILRLMT